MSVVNAVPEASFATIQEWSNYTGEEHEVWRTLYRRRMHELVGSASRVFLEGVKLIGLDEERVPEFRILTDHLAPLCFWDQPELERPRLLKHWHLYFSKERITCLELICQNTVVRMGSSA